MAAARRGFSVFYQGRLLLSKIDPLAQAERLVQQLDMRPGNLYVLPSPLLGYGLEKLIALSPPENALVCVELDEGLHRLSQEHLAPLLKKYPQRLLYIGPEQAHRLLELICDIWPIRQFRRLVVHKGNIAWTLHRGAYGAIERELDLAIHRAWSNTITMIRLGSLYAKNFIRNLPLLASSGPPGLDLSDRGLLALGAGPSLDAFLDGLPKGLQELLFCPQRPFKIICVDTALAPLRRRGIYVDFALVLEAQYWNLLDFIGCPDTPLLLDLSSHYASSRLFPHVLGAAPLAGIFTTAWVHLALFERVKKAGLYPQDLPPLGSVGLSLIEFALRFGRGPIVFAGLDFAFTLDEYHCKGSSFRLRQEARQTRLEPFFQGQRVFRPGVKGAKNMLSDPSLQSYANIFNEHFAHNPRLWDARNFGLELHVQKAGPKEIERLLLHGDGSPVDAPLGAPKDAPPVTSSGTLEDASVDASTDAHSRGRKVKKLILNEIQLLEDLQAILQGRSGKEGPALPDLLEELDYLWAHFPEYGGKKDIKSLSGDISFLKRISAEAGRRAKDWQLALSTLEQLKT